MAKSNAETIVNVIGIIAIVFGAIGALSGLLIMMGSSFFGFASMMGGVGSMMGSAIAAIAGLFAIIFGVLDILAGVYVRKHNNIARWFLLVLALLGILSFPIGTAWALFVGWAFLLNKDVVALFK